MQRRFLLWSLLSCIASPVLFGACNAADQALRLALGGNFQALGWKAPRVFFVVSAISFIAALCWALPAIAVWWATVRARPAIDSAWPTALLGPCALCALFAVAVLLAAPGLVPDAELAWVTPVAVFVLWPRVVVRSLRPGRLRCS